MATSPKVVLRSPGREFRATIQRYDVQCIEQPLNFPIRAQRSALSIAAKRSSFPSNISDSEVKRLKLTSRVKFESLVDFQQRPAGLQAPKSNDATMSSSPSHRPTQSITSNNLQAPAPSSSLNGRQQRRMTSPAGALNIVRLGEHQIATIPLIHHPS